MAPLPILQTPSHRRHRLVAREGMEAAIWQPTLIALHHLQDRQKRNQGAGTLRLRKPRTLWHSETPKDRQLRTGAQHYPTHWGSIGRSGHSMRSVGRCGWRCRSTAQAPALSQAVVSHPRSSLASPDRLRINSGCRGISPTPPVGAWSRASCWAQYMGTLVLICPFQCPLG